MPPKGSTTKRPAAPKKSAPKKAKPEPPSDEESAPESGDDSAEDSDDDVKPNMKGKKGAPKRNDKNSMAYQKGTYIIRLSDLDSDNKLNIWRIDNHQLLQLYERVKADDDSKFKRTNKYTGWMCHEGWKFVELKVKSKQNKEESIVVQYPTEDEIKEARAKCDAKEGGDASDVDGDDE